MKNLKCKSCEKLEEKIRNFELDTKAHVEGKCSFPMLSLCSAEEQRIKIYFSPSSR